MTKKIAVNLLIFTAILLVGALVGHFFHPFLALTYLIGCALVVLASTD